MWLVRTLAIGVLVSLVHGSHPAKDALARPTSLRPPAAAVQDGLPPANQLRMKPGMKPAPMGDRLPA